MAETYIPEFHHEPALDLPYFGRQSRFFPWFEEVVGQYAKPGFVYAETNAGSCSNAFAFAKKGYKVILNDLSLYSQAIASAVLGGGDTYFKQLKPGLEEFINDDVELAAYCAMLIETQGYNPTHLPYQVDVEVMAKYLNILGGARAQKHRAVQLWAEDLFNFLEQVWTSVDVMFMDFAWPWREGGATQEYVTTVDTLRQLLTGESIEFEPWTRETVIKNVLEAVDLARGKATWVLLSNQSSNYPDPETLEVALLEHGLTYERHTMTTRAEEKDNLLKQPFFREYLYAIEGLC